MSIGFPIAGSDGIGTTPADARLIWSSHWASHGVISGGAVSTASTGLTYDVASGVAVGSRGTSYGAVEFLIPSGTVTTTAGPSSGSRIDVVYALPQDPSQGDDSADVILGVVNGTAASSPTKPGIPTGAVELRAFLVPQGATKTSEATTYGSVNYALPYGASMGVWPRAIDTRNQTLPAGPETWGNTEIVLPTDRAVELRVFLTLSGTGVALTDFIVDGQLYASRKASLTGNWQTIEHTTEAELGAGRHVLAVRRTQQTGSAVAHWGLIDGVAYPGQVFRVRDLGVVQ